jgi:hypothetical protein
MSLLIHAIQALAPRWPLEHSALILWLYQRHALSLRRSVSLLSLCKIRMAHFFIVLNNSSKIRYCLT